MLASISAVLHIYLIKSIGDVFIKISVFHPHVGSVRQMCTLLFASCGCVKDAL